MDPRSVTARDMLSILSGGMDNLAFADIVRVDIGYWDLI